MKINLQEALINHQHILKQTMLNPSIWSIGKVKNKNQQKPIKTAIIQDFNHKVHIMLIIILNLDHLIVKISTQINSLL